MSKKPTNTKIEDKSPVTISARGKILGRLATEIAVTLRGKDNVNFQEHLLSGRKVIVTHAKDIVVTGRKLDQKMYYTHSGYIGNLKTMSLRDKLKTKPTDVVRHAVSGMLPKNRLRQHWMAALEIREGE